MCQEHQHFWRIMWHFKFSRLNFHNITYIINLFLLPADILVYVNDTCVLGYSHKDVVEMLKAIPIGHTVDIMVRRGYPMLYNSEGCPKMSIPRLTASQNHSPHLPPPTTTQPQAQAPLPYAQLHLNHNAPPVGWLWQGIFKESQSASFKVQSGR